MRIAERRRSADLLRAAEAHLRTVVSNAPIVLFAVDHTGVFTLSEGQGLKALGLKPGEVVGLSVFDVYRDAPQITENIRRALAGEEFKATVDVHGGPGAGLVFETQFIPVRDQKDQIIGVAGVATNITERKRAEEALGESEARYRTLAQNSVDAIYLFEPKTKCVVEANAAFCRLLGYSAEEAHTLTIYDFAAHGRAEIDAFLEQLRTTGVIAAVERVWRHKDGTLIDVHVTASKIRQAGQELGFFVARDITDRKRAERALQRSEERFRLFVEHSPAAIAMFDRDMRYLAVSRRWMSDYALSDRNIIGLSHYQVFPEIPTRWKEIHQRCLAGAVEKCEEDPFPRADGRTDWVRWEIHPWQDDGGNTGGILMFTEIVTERKRAEQKVARLNRVYAMLSGINSVIVRVRDWHELFDETCRLAVVAGKFQSAWIGTVDREQGRVVSVASHDVDGEFLERLKSLAEQDTEEARGVVWRAVKEKRVVISNDIERDPQTIRMREALLARHIRALAVLPLIISEEVAGVLVLYAGETGFFDEAEMELLEEVAGDVAFGLDHIRKEERINYLAYYDSLTGLANRSLFHERLTQFVHTAQHERHRLAVGVVDLDHFKDVNDALGRQTGDALLVQFAQRLTRTAEDASQIARLGADRFAVVLPDIRDDGKVLRTIEDMMTQCVGRPFHLADTELRIATKVGIALYPNDGADADTLFRNAEAALKKAKAGGERYLFYAQEMTERIGEKLALQSKLRRARENDEFVLYYQPKVNAKSGRVTGVEALIRWPDSKTGMTLPMDFIPSLEGSGMILEVGAWAIRRAIEDHAYWTAQGIAAPRIAVNVSAVQLRQRDFVSIVRDAVAQGAQAAVLDLEITESMIMSDVEANIGKLTEIHGLGVNIAIDDFGTGYSSLGYLARLPVQVLKIDVTFIARMLSDAGTHTLVSTMISLAHSLGLTIVAEGVETEEQAAALRRLGCDELQGYLISPPLPRDQMTELLRQRHPKSAPGKGLQS